MPALAKSSEIRPVSLVARLLTPFAGQRAGRTAELLLNRFGSLDRALSASDAQIVNACGIDVDVGRLIAAARDLIEAALYESVTRSQVDPDDPSLQKYLILKFRGRPYEELHAIFVDNSLGFLSGELVSTGDSKHVETRMRPILQRALELHAYGFLLIHNHPSGNPEPSKEDINATHKIAHVAHALELHVIDHFIIAGNVVVSMRKNGLL